MDLSTVFPRPAATRFLLVAVIAASGTAANPLPASEPSRQVTQATRNRPDFRLYLGMWTVHFRDLDRGVEDNRAIGLAWRAVYGATFVNSYGNRAYSAGIQGPIVGWAGRPFTLGIGYRAGFVTGYDERFLPLAEKTPIIPLVQPRLTLDTRHGGVELSYSGVIASAALNLRF